MAGNRTVYEEALSKGHSLSWDQRWQDAIKEFEAALAEFPEEPAPYGGVGSAYLGLNQLHKALDNFKLAARYSKGDVLYLKEVAGVQERLNQNSEAGQTYLAIGELQMKRGLLDQAVISWQRATTMQPDLLGARQRLAGYYTQQGQTQAAIREYLLIARSLQSRQEKEKAIQVCQIALKLDPRNANVLTALELAQQSQPIVLAGLDDGGPTAQATSEWSPAGAMPVSFELGTDESAPAGTSEQIDSPAQNARRVALERLAEEIFDDKEDETSGRGLRKLERDALISQALDFQTRGLVNEAISCYERVIDGVNGSTAAHFNLGLLYQEKLRFEDAIRQFQLAVKDPEYRLGSNFALGECYRARGQIDKSVEHFVTVLRIVDLNTVERDHADRLIALYENLADSLLTRGEPDKATAFANTLVEFLSRKGWEDKVKEARARLDAFSGDRVMILGDIFTAGSARVLESLYLSQEHARRNMYRTAVEEVYQAISLAPNYLPAHIQLAELLAKQNQTEAAAAKFVAIGDTFRIRDDLNGAINMYERVVQVSPLDLSIRARLIDLLKRHGQIDRSLEHYLAMGETYYQLAQVDKARETYQEALNLASRSQSDGKKWRKTLLRRVADIDLERFDRKRAMAAYKELRQEDPTDERTAMTLIDLYYQINQPAYALHELDQYLKQLVMAGRSAKVLGILEDMIQQRPTDIGLSDRLVRLYVAQNRRQQAVEVLDKLSDALLDAGESEKAITCIERIIQLKPPNVLSYQNLLKQLRK